MHKGEGGKISDLFKSTYFMLDGVDKGGESYVDSISSYSDTEFVSDKPISKMVDDTHDTFALEANVYMASELTGLQQDDCYERRENVSLFMA